MAARIMSLEKVTKFSGWIAGGPARDEVARFSGGRPGESPLTSCAVGFKCALLAQPPALTTCWLSFVSERRGDLAAHRAGIVAGTNEAK